MDKSLTDKQSFGVVRCARMATGLFEERFGEDTPTVKARLSRICRVSVNGKLYTPTLSEETKEWLNHKKVDWRDWFGEN
jgi:hypothetical protein